MTLTDNNYSSGPYGVGPYGGASYTITPGAIVTGHPSTGPIARADDGQLAKPKQGTVP